MSSSSPAERAPTQTSSGAEFRTLFGLSAPIAAGQLGMMTTGVIDTMMVARIGAAELAAIAISSTWAWSSGSLAQRLVQGMDPLVSQAHRRGDGNGSALALQRGLIIASAVSIPLMAL